AVGLVAQDRAPDRLGPGHRAARGVDPDHERLEVVVECVVEQSADALGAGRAGPGHAVADLAGYRDHADLVAFLVGLDVGQPGIEVGEGESAGLVVPPVLAGDLGYPLAPLDARPRLVG